jgi:hypothetical protein
MCYISNKRYIENHNESVEYSVWHKCEYLTNDKRFFTTPLLWIKEGISKKYTKSEMESIEKETCLKLRKANVRKCMISFHQNKEINWKIKKNKEKILTQNFMEKSSTNTVLYPQISIQNPILFSSR